MTTSLSQSSRRFKSLLLSFLLASSSLLSLGAPIAKETNREPTSVRSGITPFRNYALTTSDGARTEGRAAKPKPIKHPAMQPGTLAARFSTPSTLALPLSLDGNSSLSYSAFCYSRPGGRAPPQFV